MNKLIAIIVIKKWCIGLQPEVPTPSEMNARTYWQIEHFFNSLEGREQKLFFLASRVRSRQLQRIGFHAGTTLTRAVMELHAIVFNSSTKCPAKRESRLN